MATKKKAAKKKAGTKKKAAASTILKFNPKWIIDPVPWPWIRQLDTVAQQQIKQLRQEVATRLKQIAARQR
jgi:hypothetical protein